MRFPFLLFILIVVVGTQAAMASPIQSFIILTGSNLSTTGGSFDDDGTFSGTFSLDVGHLPTTTAPISLKTVDITTTAGFGDGYPGADYLSGNILRANTFFSGMVEVADYQLQFTSTSSSLVIDFIEVNGTFEGGQVLDAEELNPTVAFEIRKDLTGDAVAVDPALVPEPGSIGLGAVGFVVLTGVAMVRRRCA